MVGVTERPQLTFEEDGLPRLNRVEQEGRGVRDVRGKPVAKGGHLRDDLFHGKRRLAVEMLQEDVLLCECLGKPGAHERLVEQLVHLEADLQVLVRVERGDARSR